MTDDPFKPLMEVIQYTIVRCLQCGYERRLPGIQNPDVQQRHCPSCVGKQAIGQFWMPKYTCPIDPNIQPEHCQSCVGKQTIDQFCAPKCTYQIEPED